MVWYYNRSLELESIKEDHKKRKEYLIKGGAYLLSSSILTASAIGLLFSDLSIISRGLGSCALGSLAVLFSIATCRYSSKSNQLTEKIRGRIGSINKLEKDLK